MSETRRWYQASQFARLTGVTVRTLHHYDRLGLLRPSGRTASGYRLYGERDFARLQQIVTLKFIGFPLKEIKQLLDRNGSDLPRALRAQRRVLEEKRRHLDRAVQAIARVERRLTEAAEPDWEAFAEIVEVITMQNDMEWVKKYYTQEQLEELSKRWSPELQAQTECDWAALFQDIEAAIADNVDPASERAQGLAARWDALIAAFTGGNPGIQQNLEKLYADRANWPESAQSPVSPEIGAFMQRVRAARQ